MMTTADVQQVLNEMHQMELRLTKEVTVLKTKVEDDRLSRADNAVRVQDLEAKYHRLLMWVIALLGAGLTNVIISYLGSK